MSTLYHRINKVETKHNHTFSIRDSVWNYLFNNGNDYPQTLDTTPAAVRVPVMRVAVLLIAANACEANVLPEPYYTEYLSSCTEPDIGIEEAIDEITHDEDLTKELLDDMMWAIKRSDHFLEYWVK